MQNLIQSIKKFNKKKYENSGGGGGLIFFFFFFWEGGGEIHHLRRGWLCFRALFLFKISKIDNLRFIFFIKK
ncbi:hypothetical protein A0N85_08500 [Campylobacter jejuni]|nr:hypothetical protein A0N85_08500 [Campylobacter jejuni]